MVHIIDFVGCTLILGMSEISSNKFSLIQTTKRETFRQRIMLNIVYLDIKVCCKNVKMIAYRI